MPMAFYFDIGLVHFPRVAGLSIFLLPKMIEDFTVLLNPTINRSVTNIYSAIIQYFLNFTIAQIVTQVVTNSDNNHIFLKLFPSDMIHLSTLVLVFLHSTINQELWGTLQQNHNARYMI